MILINPLYTTLLNLPSPRLMCYFLVLILYVTFLFHSYYTTPSFFSLLFSPPPPPPVSYLLFLCLYWCVPVLCHYLLTSLLWLYQAAITTEISIILLICFCSFDLYLTKIFISKMCILHCLVLLNSFLFKPCLFRFTLEPSSLTCFRFLILYIYIYGWFGVTADTFRTQCMCYFITTYIGTYI